MTVRMCCAEVEDHHPPCFKPAAAMGAYDVTTSLVPLLSGAWVLCEVIRSGIWHAHLGIESAACEFCPS